jgi:cysteine desulfuration protein SufE
MSILERDKNVIEEFKNISGWEDRYQKIIAKGKALNALLDSEKSDDLKIKGCQSQVWLKAEFKEGRVYFYADSDALIVKGLVAILIEIYSGATPKEILEHKPQFISEIGLTNHLSPSRANGLFAMLKQIQFYAIAFQSISG